MGTVINYFKLLPIPLLFSIILWACSTSSEEPELEQKSEIKIDSNILSKGLEFSCDGGEQTISFTCSEFWTLSISDETWCSASSNSGNGGNATLKFTILANVNYTNRSATVTIKSGSASKTFLIKQEGKEADKIEIENTSFEVATKGESISLSFSTNTNWTASSDMDWCILSSEKGEKGKNSISLTINANEESEDRTAIVIIKAGTATKEITIEQYRLESISIEKTAYEINSDGGSFTVDVAANTNYEVKISDNWVKADKQSDGKITFTIEKNDQVQSRETVIKLAGKYIEKQFTIRQSGKNVDPEGTGKDFIKG